MTLKHWLIVQHLVCGALLVEVVNCAQRSLPETAIDYLGALIGILIAWPLGAVRLHYQGRADRIGSPPDQSVVCSLTVYWILQLTAVSAGQIVELTGSEAAKDVLFVATVSWITVSVIGIRRQERRAHRSA